MNKIINLALLACLISTTISVQAEVNQNSAAAQLVNKLTYNQVDITQEFKAANGWQGFVIKTKKQANQAILYVDPNNHYLFAGALISADGTNLTQQYTDEYIVKPIAKSANQTVAKLKWISEGSDSAPHKLYVLIDPNCIYCHMIYQSLSAYITKNQVQVRWVPVGLINASSPGKAAHLLSIISPADQVNALKQNENNFNTQQEQGGITVLDATDPSNKAAFEALAQNNAFFTQNQFVGTPVILYTDEKGNPKVYQGLVQNKNLEQLVSNASGSW